MLDPGEVGIAGRRRAVDPAFVVFQEIAAPVTVVEGRIGEHVIRLEIGMPVVVKRVAVRDLSVDAPDRKVHLR